MPTETGPSPPDTISTTSEWTVDLHYNKSPYDAARTKQVIRTLSLTRLGEFQHTALGDTTTKWPKWPDHRVTTHDVNHICTYTQLGYLRKSERKTLLLLQLSFALFRLLVSFVLSSIHTHGMQDTAAMKSVQEETQKTVSDFASGTWHIRKHPSAWNETSIFIRNCWTKFPTRRKPTRFISVCHTDD